MLWLKSRSLRPIVLLEILPLSWVIRKDFHFFMLLNILGGPGMNSRLNLALREKYGFVYNVEANYHPFSDTGLFAIFYGTEKSQAERSKKLVLKN